MKILPLNIIRLLILALGISMLAGCASNSSVTSSFGKRKYTKGYFVDIPKARPSVTSGKTHESERQNIEGSNVQKVELNKIVLSKNSKISSKVKSIIIALNVVKKQVSKEYVRPQQIETIYSIAKSLNDTPNSFSDKSSVAKTGLILIIIAVALVLSAILLSSVSGFPWGLFILLAIVLGIIGIADYVKGMPHNNATVSKPNNDYVSDSTSQNPNNSDKQTYDTKYGLAGLLCMILGILVIFIAAIMIFSAALSALLSIAVFGVLLGLIALASIIVGLVFCIMALNHNDKYRTCAVVGLFILGIVVALIAVSIAAG